MMVFKSRGIHGNVGEEAMSFQVASSKGCLTVLDECILSVVFSLALILILSDCTSVDKLCVDGTKPTTKAAHPMMFAFGLVTTKAFIQRNKS